MASIISALNIGYSGLNASQLGITTTGNNISNANTTGYTRQRVVTEEQTPTTVASLSVGSGTKVQDIARVFNQFVYNTYSSASADKSYADTLQSNLQQLSTYFPSLSTSGNNSGVQDDLNTYFTDWQSLADNPSSSAAKTTLATDATTLANDIKTTSSQISQLQSTLNDQLKTDVDEVNTLASQIANLNKQIANAEAGTTSQANALRDKRDTLALSLSKLVGGKVTVGAVTGNTPVDSNIATTQGSYNISVGGFSIVDGPSYHPLTLDNKTNASGMYDLYYQRQDGVNLTLSQSISSGEIGAILSLRGSTVDPQTGDLTNGSVQNVKDQLDAFAKGLIQQTNNLYAQTPTTYMQSNTMNIGSSTPIVNTGLGVKTGSFDLKVYDSSGNVVSQRTINIDASTTFASGSDSIQAQVAAAKDDNNDGNANNDLNSYLQVNYNASASSPALSIGFKNSSLEAQGYTFSLSDNLTDSSDFSSGTNFAGALGLNRFFDGSSSSDIAVSTTLAQNPTKIAANTTPVSGNNENASNMVQMQYQKNNYTIANSNVVYNDTVNGMFSNISTGVGAIANAAQTTSDAVDAHYNTVEQSYNSVSGVNTDEELTNLIKYQTAYGAAAKVITTVEQITTTLLGIKQ